MKLPFLNKKKKHQYHFNTKSLTFERVRVSVKQKVRKYLYSAAVGLVFSVVVMLIAYNLFSSPKEKMLQREIEQYKLQYEMLSERMDKVNAVLTDIEDRDDNIYRVIFEAEPVPNTIRQAAYGGADRYAKLEGYSNSKMLISLTKKLDLLSRRLYVQSKSFDEVLELTKNKTEMMSCIPAIMPIKNGATKVCSGFGYRLHPIYKTIQFHPGIDILVPRGTPIYATGDGVVQTPTSSLSGYGICAVINHGFGYQTLYGHMSRKLVTEGQKVKRGQLIGYVGSTGMSTAPHLHYEVWKGGKRMNPVNYFYNDLTPEEYQKVIELSSKITQALS
ncbi:MAG TPA: M23 family metallopeptidase [Bacteroidales bacterium]|nr:M23 family metallopeptidase [Bacteroidales bacterium]HPS18336.1 M23 family metallopeptidase [Bacteroidales bacterium]